MTIHLYAEHLVNIRALSIQAALDTLSDQETKATLSTDGSVLRLEHDGDTAEIQLPVHVPGNNHASLIVPPAPSKNLTFRVALQEKPDSSGLLPSGDSIEQAPQVPWTASSLSPDTELSCKQCHRTIVKRKTITAWKDLPSENWAEMMDFWHCHRPHAPHDHDHKTPSKGYSAGSTLAIRPGVGLVDPVDFVLAAKDCENLEVGISPFHPSASHFDIQFLRALKEPALSGRKVSIKGSFGIQVSKIEQRVTNPISTFMVDPVRSPSLLPHVSSPGLGAHGPDGMQALTHSQCFLYIDRNGTKLQIETDSFHTQIQFSSSDEKDEILHCRSCNTPIGHVHTGGGYKLRKVHLSLSSSLDRPSISFDPRKWLTCLLLSSINCQGVRKFTATSTGLDTKSLKLWVFAPDINVSSSSNTESPLPIRAAKVFWQDVDTLSQDVGALNRQTLMEGELEMHPYEMHALRQNLTTSASILPESARTFQGWKVAVLPRFTITDVER